MNPVLFTHYMNDCTKMQLLNSTFSTKMQDMFAITADYRPHNQNKPVYYVYAGSRREAIEKFQRRISWLKVYECKLVDGETARDIANHPYNNIVIE